MLAASSFHGSFGREVTLRFHSGYTESIECANSRPQVINNKITVVQYEGMDSTDNQKKAGIAALVGRPNVGKSTLLNMLLGQKVSITSPKPQTTRFNLQAVFEDDRGQIIFVDTPGIFGKVEDPLAKKINPKAAQSIEEGADVVVYIVDHTRERDFEENKALGIVRKAKVPKILVINKIDVRRPSHIVQYKFMEDEFEKVIELSALTGTNLNAMVDAIFSYLPVREPIVDTKNRAQPGLNIDSRLFVAELIREKAFLFLRREVPYSLTSVVDVLEERANGTLYVKGRILTSSERYKGMIIGKNGVMIKEISMATRKELETARSKKVYVELSVETDPHWVEYM